MDFAKIIAGGHVASDLVVRQGKENQEFGTFSLAVNQHTGAQETAAFYDCIAPGAVLQGMQKAGVKKGSWLMLMGQQTIRTYKSRTGEDRTAVSIKVLDWQYLGGRTKNEASGAAEPAQASGHTGGIRPAVDLHHEDDLPV